TAVDSSVTTNEDVDQVFAGADFSFTDLSDSPANTLAAVLLTSLPANGSLLYNTTALVATDLPKTVSAADLAAGKLVFRPAADANGSPYASFQFKVRDGGGTLNVCAETSVAAARMTLYPCTALFRSTAVDSSVTTNEDVDQVFAGADFS